MKLILIDDNEKLAELYKTILNSSDYEVYIETKPENALESIHNNKPDLVLLDIMMEPISGWEVLEQIRKDTTYYDIPVMILTGKVLTIEECLKYGMQIEGFVMKPLEKTMLIAAIAEIFEILSECDDRYQKAIKSGMSEEQASECRSILKKKKMLSFLKETLEKQEILLSLRPEEHESLMNPIEELRNFIGTEFVKMNKMITICPDG